MGIQTRGNNWHFLVHYYHFKVNVLHLQTLTERYLLWNAVSSSCQKATLAILMPWTVLVVYSRTASGALKSSSTLTMPSQLSTMLYSSLQKMILPKPRA